MFSCNLLFPSLSVCFICPLQLRDLIQRLLVKDVTKRLGCLRGGASDVKAHRFFRTIDWDALYRKAVPAPWRPVVRSLVDTSNFDQYDEDDRVEPYRAGDDPNAWDKVRRRMG